MNFLQFQRFRFFTFIVLAGISFLSFQEVPIKENTNPNIKPKLINGLYKIGIFILKGDKKTEYEVIEFTFKWKRKNFKYEFVLPQKGQWLSAQAMDYFRQAKPGDVIIIRNIIAKTPDGKKIKMQDIQHDIQ